MDLINQKIIIMYAKRYSLDKNNYYITITIFDKNLWEMMILIKVFYYVKYDRILKKRIQ